MKQKYNTIHELYACNKHRRYNKIGKNMGGLESVQRREADPDVMLLLPLHDWVIIVPPSPWIEEKSRGKMKP
jgi:hypothetical protein